MHAAILAGGFGTRLRSVVKDVPKPMAPVNGRPFLEYLINNLKSMGINDIILCLHYEAYKIQNYFQDGAQWGVKIKYSTEERPLGTGGAIGLLRNIVDRTFCVINGDTYFDIDFHMCLSEHKHQSAMITMALAAIKNTSRYGQVVVDRYGRIKGFNEKDSCIGTEGNINAGFYLLEPDVFGFIKENFFVSFEKDILPGIISSGKRIISYQPVKNFFDIGTPEDYQLFSQWAKKIGK